jgi:hypothetical protein
VIPIKRACISRVFSSSFLPHATSCLSYESICHSLSLLRVCCPDVRSSSACSSSDTRHLVSSVHSSSVRSSVPAFAWLAIARLFRRSLVQHSPVLSFPAFARAVIARLCLCAAFARPSPAFARLSVCSPARLGRCSLVEVFSRIPSVPSIYPFEFIRVPRDSSVNPPLQPPHIYSSIQEVLKLVH